MSEDDNIKQMLVDELLDEIKFEQDFFAYIAGTEYYEIIDVDAHSINPPDISEEIERRTMEKRCETTKHVILYRISYGNFAVVMSKDDPNKTGIVPTDNPNGWSC